MRATILIICLFIICSCKNKYNKTDDELFVKAHNYYFKYSQTGERIFLDSANYYADCIDCSPMPRKVFELKIMLKYIMKDYDGGKKYIERLKESDFALPYEKNTHLKIFDALAAESNGDSIRRNEIYSEIAREIQAYLDKYPNEKSLTDLFGIKIFFEKKDSILKEIEEVRSLKIYKKKFLNTLKQSIENYDPHEQTDIMKLNRENK